MFLIKSESWITPPYASIVIETCRPRKLLQICDYSGSILSLSSDENNFLCAKK